MHTMTPTRDESDGFRAYTARVSELQIKWSWIGTNHVAEVAPLVEEVPVDIDTVRFAEVFRDEGAYGGEEFFLQAVLVLDIAELVEHPGNERSRHRESGYTVGEGAKTGPLMLWVKNRRRDIRPWRGSLTRPK